jgi:hypothetical protein
MRRVGPFLLVALVAIDVATLEAETAPAKPSSGAFLDGWDNWVLEGSRAPGVLELRLNLGGERSDNLRQSPTGGPREQSSAARTEGRLTCRLLPVIPLKSYVELGQVRYAHRDATTAFGAGLGLDGEKHAVQLVTRFERDRPSIDLGDGLNFNNDTMTLRLRYALRTKRLEAWVFGERVDLRCPERPIRNGALFGGQAGVLYLGLSRRVAPELSFGWQRNDAVGDSEIDFRQTRAQVGARLTPGRIVAITARLEYLDRTHEIINPASRNFGRRDRRFDGNLQAQFRLARNVAWTIVYDRLDGNSSRTNREFMSHFVSGMLTVRMGSTEASRKPLRAPGARPPTPVAMNPTTLVPHEPPAPPSRGGRNALDEAAAMDVPPLPPASAPAAADEPSRVALPTGGVREIVTLRHGDVTEVTIEVEGLRRYSTFQLQGPPRFVLDLDGVKIKAQAMVPLGGTLVGSIRVAPFRVSPFPVARIVFDLEAPAVADVEPVGTALRVRLRPRRLP